MSLVEPSFDVFNHHNRIIHHNSNREDQSKEGEVIEAEPDRRHDCERTDDRDGDGDQRNQSGTPILKEDEHHDRDEDQCIAKRLEYFNN